MAKHLTYHDRVKIETLYNAKHSVAYIAKAVHHTRQTIYNELKRGSYTHLNSDYTENKSYSADLGQSLRDRNQSGKGPDIKIGNDMEFANFLEDIIINKKFSPSAALFYIKNNNLKFKTSICRQTLYKYIDMGIFLKLTNKDLAIKGNRKKKYKKVRRLKRASMGESIENRPLHISDRNTFGNWEMDTVKGRQRATKGCLLVLTERLTRHEIVIKLDNQKSASVVSALNDIKQKWNKDFNSVFKTITVDNGSEFADYESMRNNTHGKPADIYYCHPYAPHERGSNENQNKLIRRHIPKGSDIDQYDKDFIQSVEAWVNNYPRKIFNGKTSQEMFNNELRKLGIEQPK